MAGKSWSTDILDAFQLPHPMPTAGRILRAVRHLLPEIAEQAALPPNTKVFAGGADNACGAIGAGILEEGQTMRIGTSGVVLS